MSYHMSDEEARYLKDYDIRKFEQPSVTVDIAVFTLMAEAQEENGEQDYRKDPLLSLSLLLIKRGGYPYKGSWALPGGFAKPQEDLEESAKRELQEETSVEHAYLKPFGTFSKKDRDPRGWIISNGFLALVDAKDYRVHAETDAWDAKWFRIQVESEDMKKHVSGDQAEIVTIYRLVLSNACEDLRLIARVEERRWFIQHHEKKEYQILESEGFAFDHAQIILQAFMELRRETENEGTIVFDLMPEKFTLNMLQDTYENILGKPLLTPNFRRKILPYVVETNEKVLGVGHRPAKLFKRNLETFYT
ncbi:MAG: NUDIX hydrolase [Blautia sp.]|nr:NUDIX hydrolase [Blautia sp.]